LFTGTCADQPAFSQNHQNDVSRIAMRLSL
jgi:hypothetical protein